MRCFFIPIFIGFLSYSPLSAQTNQTDYSNHTVLSQRINTLAKSSPNLVKARSLVKTAGGSDIWCISIGTGETNQKPAIAIVGGVEGKHLLGVEMAIGLAEYLVKNANNEQVKKILDKQSFYIFPNMSPDASEQYFAKLKYERSGNATALDYDRDGKKGEDGYDDLDGNGKITLMRVENTTGKYMLNPNDPRSLVLANKSKGQIGKYDLYSEGFDNDKDGSLNEDGDEGVHFNKNSTYAYMNFAPGAGEFAVSELENRALFDLLYDSFNIYTVLTFGPNNNLSHVASKNSGYPSDLSGNPSSLKLKLSNWSNEDLKTNTYISEQYNKILGKNDAPKTQTFIGDFSDWAYYHYGRLSFSTPGWWVPKVKNSKENVRNEVEIEDPVVNYLRWAEAENIQNTFTEWTEVKHPDFPNQKVEVGGLDPFVLNNPPYKMVGDIVQKHAEFVVSLAQNAPLIEITGVKTEKLDNNLHRVSLKIFNNGFFPTHSQFGNSNYFVKKIAVRLQMTDKQKLVSGNKVELINSIAGREFVELTWLVQGNGKLVINASSPHTGSDKTEISLN